jgi:hypothetical protein
MFFYKAGYYLKKLSKRTKFDYCHFDSRKPIDGHSQEFGRYSAFNTCASENTVEIRIFRGTIDYKRFLASLQFADAFANYIPARSYAFMSSHTSGEIWTDFIDFLKKTSQYNQLLKHILKRGIV